MNANELAEKLLDCLSSEDRLEIRSASAQMLRKQQAEIDRLTMLCDCMTTESNRKGNEIEALKAGKIRAYDNGVEDGRKPNTNLVKEAKYGITTKWDGITTYHETNELIGKAQEK